MRETLLSRSVIQHRDGIRVVNVVVLWDDAEAGVAIDGATKPRGAEAPDDESHPAQIERHVTQDSAFGT